MSRIDDLIEELCPDGVEFRELEQLIRLNFGTRITKMNDSGTKYPVYGGGGESFRTDSFNRENEFVISRFAMSENCVRKVEGKFWLLDSGFTFDTTSRDIHKDYVAYWLLNDQTRIYECSSQGAQKNLKTTEFKRFRIPVPPRAVQREIVRILDKFTQLEAELEAELEARRKQYEYYRDELLAFSDDHNVRWVAMGKVGSFTRGRRFTRKDMVDQGIPCIHYGEIYTHYGTYATETQSFVRDGLDDGLRYAQPGDVVIACVGETVPDVGKSLAWIGNSPVAIHDDCFSFHSSLDPKYAAYVMQTMAFGDQKAPYVSRAKVKRLSGESLARIIIPVPPRDVQKQVVEVLDQFDALVNDRSIGLPAELAARRRQYEYYRDKLLTFRELEAA